MRPEIITNPSTPMPSATRGRKPRTGAMIEWGYALQILEIGQVLVVPQGVGGARASNACMYWGRKTGRRFVRRGNEIWRVE